MNDIYALTYFKNDLDDSIKISAVEPKIFSETINIALEYEKTVTPHKNITQINRNYNNNTSYS